MTSRLAFFEKSHRYKMDGEWVPGVTTLIGDGLPKKQLMYWSARTVAEWVADHPDELDQMRVHGRGPLVAFLKETPWQKRDDAADRGTIVHGIAEKVALGQAVEVDDRHAGYIEAAIAFLDDFGVEPLIVERPCYHAEHRWAGTFDLIGRLADGRVALCDWKTADSGIWPETALQLSAYSRATHYQDRDGNDHSMPHVDLAIGVHLQPGGYTAYQMRCDDWTYSRFRHIAICAAVSKSMKERDQWMTEMPSLQTKEGAA